MVKNNPASYYIGRVPNLIDRIAMDEELQKKMDGYNEMLLKNTAITFSSEGLTRDLKVLITRKADFVADMLNGMAALIGSLPASKSSRKRAQMIDAMLNHALNEVHTVNSTMNYVIARIFEKEVALAHDEAKPAVPTTKQVKGAKK